MNRLLLATATLSAIISAGSAMAADMPLKAPIIKPVPIFSWTGCYFGGNVGGKTARVSGSVDIPAATGLGGPSPASSFGLSDNLEASTVIFGGQVGCNYQAGPVVFGIEADADWHNWSRTQTVLTAPVLFVPGDTFDIRSRWQSSARGRVGYAFDRYLIYATGGVAWTNLQVGSNFIAFGPFPATVVSDSKTLTGATLGGGFEMAIWQNFSFGVEGRYTWYDNNTFNSGLVATSLANGFTTAPATTRFRLVTIEGMAKLNYRLDWGRY